MDWQKLNDAGKTPLIDNSTKAEPFDESRHEKVAENNAKHATRLCRGNDGRVRQLCGPRINFVTGRPAANYMMRALDTRECIGKLVHSPKRMEPIGVRSDLIEEKTERKSRTHKMPRDHISFQSKRKLEQHQFILAHKKIQEAKEEPALAVVEPNFHTPPCNVKL